MKRQHEQRGNGDVCPVDTEHGRMYMLVTGRQFCPHEGHGLKGHETPAVYENDGTTVARARRQTGVTQ